MATRTEGHSRINADHAFGIAKAGWRLTPVWTDPELITDLKWRELPLGFADPVTVRDLTDFNNGCRAFGDCFADLLPEVFGFLIGVCGNQDGDL